MPYLTTSDGIELFYRDLGTGKPVLLIHGWPLNSDSWDVQVNFLLEQGRRVITYDRRGFGRSSQAASGFDYDTLADDLNTLIEHLKLEGVTLVGFSMGGGEVIRYLTRYGCGRVPRAVLVSAVTPFLLKTGDNPEGVDPKVFDEIAVQLRKDRPASLEDFAPKFYGRTPVHHTVSAAVLEWNQEMALTGSLLSTLATARSWSSTDFREEMKAIEIPILVIHGTADKTVPIEVSGRRSAALLAHGILSEYEGEPHGLFLTAADRLNDELVRFTKE